jgi:hypothetical protein
VADQPKVVGDSITTFLIEMLYAIIAVILVTMVLLPFRVATVAATSIPISIFCFVGDYAFIGYGIEYGNLGCFNRNPGNDCG